MAVSDIDPKLSRLYRERSTEGPPPALDAAILAAARQHLVKPKRYKRPWWSRWMVPAGLMATLVLGVSVTLLIVNENPEAVEGYTVRQSSSPPPRTTEAAKTKLADSVSSESVARKDESAFALPAKPTQAAPNQALPISNEAKREPGTATAQVVPAEGKLIMPSAADEIQPEHRAKNGESRLLREANVASDVEVEVGASAPSAPPALKTTPTHSQAVPRTPEAWLDDIRHLIRDGHEKEAIEQLTQFRTIYPQVNIPEDIGVIDKRVTR